jgi:hypothetical protein
LYAVGGKNTDSLKCTRCGVDAIPEELRCPSKKYNALKIPYEI